MVNLMLNLFVNHIVENYPAIDYIAIKTKKGEEISLNWEESEYSWNDDQSGSGRSLKTNAERYSCRVKECLF